MFYAKFMGNVSPLGRGSLLLPMRIKTGLYSYCPTLPVIPAYIPVYGTDLLCL